MASVHLHSFTHLGKSSATSIDTSYIHCNMSSDNTSLSMCVPHFTFSLSGGVRVTDSCYTAQLHAPLSRSTSAVGSSSSAAATAEEAEEEEDLPLDSFERNPTCWRCLKVKHAKRSRNKAQDVKMPIKKHVGQSPSLPYLSCHKFCTCTDQV